MSMTPQEEQHVKMQALTIREQEKEIKRLKGVVLKLQRDTAVLSQQAVDLLQRQIRE